MAALQSAISSAPIKAGSHRIPLGLLLLSRQQLTATQLRIALAAQQTAGCGRMGDWLLNLGFVTEPNLLAALGSQFSCPVLQINTPVLTPVLYPEIPMALLDSFQMVPVSFVAATATLHIAFAAKIDHSMLYAVEQMLDCRTRHCLISPALLRNSLFALGASRLAREVVFERISGNSELVRIISNYAVRVSASGIRLSPCRPYLWARLECASGQILNLLLRIPANPCSPDPARSNFESLPAS
ncbi:MAG TPA: hypothetical protein VI386_33330 [Candidatus Sulfotelmatobacter sp.]